MSVLTNGQRIQLQEQRGFGGKHFNTVSMAELFNYDQPHDFGVMVSQIFTASNKFGYKAITDMTEASGNTYEITGSLYKWTLFGDDYRYLRVIKNLETSNTRPGINGSEFKIGLSEGWHEEPDVLMPENNEYFCEIVGKPINRGNYWEYTLRLQTSDPNAFLPVEELYEGREWRAVSTSVATEENQIFGTTQFGSQVELQSQIGAYAREFSLTDRMIREQINKTKTSEQINRANSVMGGYAFQLYDSKNNKPIDKAGFMTFLEAKLMDETELDCEVMMYFGKASVRKDYTGKYIKRTGPGFRELVKDGHEWIHNGSFTLEQLENYLMSIFLTRIDEGEREITISTGTLGHRIFDELISEEVSGFLTLDRYYVQPMAGGSGANDLQYGYQFKRFIAKNGIVVNLQSNPLLDDRYYCPRRYPNNNIYSVDSARMDIMDFGSSSSSMAPGQANMAMIKEAGVDSYYVLGGVIDPRKGVVTDGSFIQNGMKSVYFRREKSGSLNVWDTSRIGAIVLEPNL